MIVPTSTAGRTAQPVLLDRIWETPADSAGQTLTRNATAVLGGSLLIAAAAQFSIPLGPVPFTLQTLALLVLGASLGSTRASLAAGLYLVEGAVGLPVFAEFKSTIAFSGPTVGYLIGFPVTAWIIGRLAEAGWDRRGITMTAAQVIALVPTFGLGMLGLSLFGLAPIEIGLLPFLPGLALKIAAASVISPVAWKVAKGLGSEREKSAE